MSLVGLMMYQDQASTVRDLFCACMYVFCVFCVVSSFLSITFFEFGAIFKISTLQQTIRNLVPLESL